MKYWSRKSGWIWVVVLAGAALLFGKDMLAAGLSNLALRTILREWQVLRVETGPPHCDGEATGQVSPGLLDWLSRLGSDQPQALATLGRAAWLQGDCGEAKRYFEAAYRENPEDKNLAFWLYWLEDSPTVNIRPPLEAGDLAAMCDRWGLKAEESGMLEAAAGWYTQAVKLAPERERGERLANLYHEMGQGEAAQEMWQAIVATLAPEEADHWWALGRLAESDQDWGSAAQAYRQAAGLAEQPYVYWMQAAEALEKFGDWEGMEHALQMAVEAEPGVIWPYLKLGHLRRLEKRYDEALSWYQKAEALRPDYYAGYYFSGETLFEAGNCNQAKGYLEKAFEFPEMKAKSAYYLAQCLYQENQIAAAIEKLNQAIELEIDKQWRWFEQLGDWQAGMGQAELALQAYQEAIELDPENPGLKTKIEALIEAKP